MRACTEMIPRQRIQNNPPPKEQCEENARQRKFCCAVSAAAPAAALFLGRKRVQQPYTRMRDQKSSFSSLSAGARVWMQRERGVGDAFRDAALTKLFVGAD